MDEPPFDGRYRRRSVVGDPTLADAILDRLVHNAYRIELTGEDMRKRRPLDPAA